MYRKSGLEICCEKNNEIDLKQKKDKRGEESKRKDTKGCKEKGITKY